MQYGKPPSGVKSIVNISDLKPLHAKWVVEMYDYLKKQNESIVKCFEKARVLEAVKSAHKVYTRCENPFDENAQDNLA